MGEGSVPIGTYAEHLLPDGQGYGIHTLERGVSRSLLDGESSSRQMPRSRSRTLAGGWHGDDQMIPRADMKVAVREASTYTVSKCGPEV